MEHQASYERRKTRQITVGDVPIGGDAPVTVQSMTTTKTADVEATLVQIYALAAAGALLRPGLTGTNVMDVMVVLVGDRPNLKAAGDQPESDNPHQAGS